jgi:glycosyltransferase involved in cell wall biosynthesis
MTKSEKINLAHEKINEYLCAQLKNESNEIDLSSASKNIYYKIYQGNIDTKNLSGIKLKIVEFYNTLIRLVRGRRIVINAKNHELAELQQKFINFCKRNDLTEFRHAPEHENRIFVDFTFTISQDSVTGIPRVVAELIQNSVNMGVTPVCIYDKAVYTIFADKKELTIVEPREKDIVVFPDAAWNYPQDIEAVIYNLSKCGGKSVVLIHDLIPLVYPQLSNENHVTAFKNWLNIIISHANTVVCVSESVFYDFLRAMDNYTYNSISLRSVGWCHLGSDFKVIPLKADAKLALTKIEIPQPYFLSVGTVEPRKAYTVCIDAMELIWEKELDASFVIVGKYGWSQSVLKERILKHPEYQRRLFWFDAASDVELRSLYSNALALVSSSLSEGFGLPIIEAAHNGLSSIVSDIPVFREIGGRSTKFFEVTNSRELSFQLEWALQKPKVKPDLDFLTWEESISQLIEMIKRDEYQYKKC